ncbi:MAG: hypothetical protein N2544_08060 [Burkholderiales bacterium]|nr:hypothetical protein [Burkholderiales bacterium]
MIRIAVPGFGALAIEHVVLDYNGTLAVDGTLLPGVAERIGRLARDVAVHVVTADTFGSARAELAALPCEVVVLAPAGQAEAKRAFVERLGAARCACVGNGRNDRAMLAAAALGIAVLQAEGASGETLASADVVAPDIRAALDLLLVPQRLVATLRD